MKTAKEGKKAKNQKLENHHKNSKSQQKTRQTKIWEKPRKN